MQAGRARINGEIYPIYVVRAATSNAYARIDGNRIIVKVPARLDDGKAAEVFEKLRDRFVRRLNKIRYRKPIRIEFNDNDTILVLGRRMLVRLGRRTANRFSAKVVHGSNAAELRIVIPEAASGKEDAVSEVARRAIAKSALHALRERVYAINGTRFRFGLNGVRISKDGRSRWGSCNTRRHTISIGFRLLFAPQEILDFVIIHELAHLKEPSHGKRFWETVRYADPLCREHAAWLSANGNFLAPTYER